MKVKFYKSLAKARYLEQSTFANLENKIRERTLLTRLAFLWLTWLWYHFCHTRFFMPKPSTHCMHDPGSIVPHIWPKVFTENQMS
jgi:hypothetical protein